MNRFSFVPLAFGSLLVGACAQATARSSTTPSLKTGTYHIEDYLRGDASRIKGTVTLFPDTATLNLEVGNCVQTPVTSNAAAVFRCDGGPTMSEMRIVIDRYSPEQRSSWSAKQPTTAKVTTCEAYAVTPMGEQYCTKYQTEARETERALGGQLRVVRVDSLI